MNNPTSRYGVPILAGNIVRLADGRTGTVEAVEGSVLEVEVAAARTSRTQVFAAADLFETVFAEAAEVAHAA